MADQIPKSNPYIRYGIVVIVLGFFIWSYFQGQKPLVQTGKLEYRMVTGIKDGNFQVILLETSDRFVILDSVYREVLITEDGELISRPKQVRLFEKYQDIEYRIGLNEASSGLKPGYRVTRELFNAFKFGEPMQYEVNRKKGDSLTGIIP